MRRWPRPARRQRRKEQLTAQKQITEAAVQAERSKQGDVQEKQRALVQAQKELAQAEEELNQSVRYRLEQQLHLARYTQQTARFEELSDAEVLQEPDTPPPPSEAH